MAACDSEFGGKIFLKCGAKHVICIKGERSVYDSAAITFTRIFYDRIIKGKPVCEAFNTAKSAVARVEEKENEADLFMIFTQEQRKELDP